MVMWRQTSPLYWFVNLVWTHDAICCCLGFDMDDIGDEDEVDPEIKNDPIYILDLQVC